ncbi:MAG: hypothetical protein V4582_01470 [Pseudomonadota bacterium]
MHAKTILAATSIMLAAGSALGADAPATGAAAVAKVAVSSAALSLNLPTVSIRESGGARSRAEVRAEAEQFVKNYKTAFAQQLELYKN